MLDFIVTWIERQFSDRLSENEKLALCDRMMRRYSVDPEHYDSAGTWALNDDATVAGEG